MFESLDQYSDSSFGTIVDPWNRLSSDSQTCEISPLVISLRKWSYYQWHWAPLNHPVVDRFEMHCERRMTRPFEIFVERFYRDSSATEVEFLWFPYRMWFVDYLSFFARKSMKTTTSSLMNSVMHCLYSSGFVERVKRNSDEIENE